MDLDKLKKAALDKTIKIFRDGSDKEKLDTDSTDGRFEEFAKKMDVRMDTAPDGEDDMGATRRFRLREVLGGLMHEPEDEEPESADAEQAEADADTSAQAAAPVTETPSPSPDASEKTAAAAVPYELISEISEIKSGIDELRGASAKSGSDEALAEQNGRLDDISRRLSTIKNMLEKQSDSTTKSVVNINAKLNAQDDRLTDIITSLGSVSKLNDSVFDLKNAQMNTRNSIDSLETSFSRLKRKMTAGITVLSILSAVLIVLEVLNLLS